MDPGQDAAPLFLQSCTRIAYAELATSDGGSDGEVSITFDAKRATKAQLQSVERWYTQWAAQWRSEHRDQIPKRTRKLPSTRSAILAIRAFDGRAAGASVPQIALALFADGRDRRAGRLTPRDVEAACKKARRAIKLADWLTQEGYLELALKETYRPADELATPTKSSV
ncbi:MAG TPA: DUF2285 domain-containing protein [Casimicrobiaceae bacterium]|nr:DUF2285 domain-containing protein [Casimicrobiaceae bacterium]